MLKFEAQPGTTRC